MGDNKETSTSGPTNSMVDPTLTKLLQGLSATYDTAPVTAPNLTGGWASQISAANNPDYARGVAGSTKELADIASGSRFGMNDPGYASLRAGALDDAMTGVASSFLTDGRFGSSVMGDAAGKAATETLAGLDYGNFLNDQQRQMQAISALPSAFAMGQAPGAVQEAVGNAQQRAPWTNLGLSSSILAGTAGAGGTTTTQPGAPWWQAPVAIGGTLAGAFF